MWSTYAVVLWCCLAATVPWELLVGAPVLRRPWRLVATIAAVLVVFGTWDVLATRGGWWSFSDDAVAGARVLGLPVEELSFFVVVPLCTLITFELLAVIGPLASRRSPSSQSARP